MPKVRIYPKKVNKMTKSQVLRKIAKMHDEEQFGSAHTQHLVDRLVILKSL